MNKRTLIAVIIAGVGALGSLVSLSFVPFEKDRVQAQVDKVVLKMDTLEYKVHINYIKALEQRVDEWYIVKDIKQGANSHGIGILTTYRNLWGNIERKSLSNVYYTGVIYSE